MRSPNNFVGDLVPTDRGWVVVPPTCCPAGHDYADGGLVCQLRLVHLQRPTHGVALHLRRNALRAPARHRDREAERGLPGGDSSAHRWRAKRGRD